ncbi:MAG: penicillin acylase family protein [Flavisolibacter sp.]
MRTISFFIGLIFTLTLIFLLNHKWGMVPPLGKFLSPQQGFWQNAEPAQMNRNEHFVFSGLQGKVSVYLDNRLVPHVFAQQDRDAYFVQGYLHAKYRLWQMEFQAMAAAGRVSEVIGDNPKTIHFDREQRRLGMVSAAERTLEAIDSDPTSKVYFTAYTDGVNAFIQSLSESQLPVEYKLLNYKPEAWSNLKIALFLKMMSKDLTGSEKDLELTNEKSVFSLAEIDQLYPQISDSSQPIIPKGIVFDSPGIIPVTPATADSLYFGKDSSWVETQQNKPSPLNGSNNWVVNGSKTKSGVPILCNDPHLNLTLPSIWYEMQITTPTMNVYGATLPGSPNVIIGFNDSIAFGFTNAARDVKDYFYIKFQDASKKAYWFNGKWKATQLRVEAIKVRSAETIFDTVAYTVFGPVMYDQSFSFGPSSNKAIAVRWTAHDSSNEGAVWLKLDRAKNYTDYLNAIKEYVCPGQNMIFASKTGDIAIWQQGKFPARWTHQGSFVMPGEDSSYMWQGFIPQSENPHVLNPTEGYIQSANQRPVDSTYPYFIPGSYIAARGITISKKLQVMQNITPLDMMELQNNYYNSVAAAAVPLLLRYVEVGHLNEAGQSYLAELKNWDFIFSANSKAATIYQAWLDTLKNVIWNDEFSKVKGPVVLPDEQTLVEALLKDSSFKFIDDIHTPAKESINEQITKSFSLASQALAEEETKDGLVWWKHKNTSIFHILSTLKPFAREGLRVGGSSATINAITKNHGPSWRMVVQLSNPTEAYGIFPGGESGNPGSLYYDNFVDDWAAGKYYQLWMMKG